MVNFKINNIDVSVEENTTILQAARKYHIDIPTLCNYPDLEIKSDCRVCVVEIEGQKRLFTSCSTVAREGMVINTNSPKVLNARKTIIELILANHDANCTACPKNLNCELQTLANKLGIDKNRFPTVLEVKPIDDKNPVLVRNINRCIKCGRCIDVCKNIQAMSVLDIMGRSKDIEITPAYGKYLTDEFCTYCGQCSSVCPVGAIIEKDDTDQVWEALNNPHLHVVVQVAPAVRVSLGEELGMEPGSIVTDKIVAALNYLGFDAVYDTDFTADLTIIEEGNELIHRVTNNGVLPMITSCCPGWINFAEQKYPDILDHISSCKSPQQMFGALAKSYYPEKIKKDPKDIFVVSIMPCTAKKYEAKRAEMSVDNVNPDVDVVLTTRELGKMIKQMGINFDSIKGEEFDKPFGITTGAAAIFGATGGVMEAALRTVYEVVNKEELKDINFTDVRGTKGLKEAEVDLGGTKVKVAVAHTLANAKIVCDQVREGTSPYTFIEIMTCPGGCIGGGGQPYGTTSEVREKRIEAVYQVDEDMSIRKSHDNPDIKALYDDYLEKPLGEKSHKLLHTHYKARNK
ncbi:NADH-dependent [FeFe] hydrogenase, group A6 [Candidatus Izemoplasma sp. B36]|uniref:NADH-dependent [FeFe] hydrogenase, group A6 n=1 Tax=Candidatus Izemoplasma sp. B36 TaxID=3242468 RepID=UPI003555F25D